MKNALRLATLNSSAAAAIWAVLAGCLALTGCGTIRDTTLVNPAYRGEAPGFTRAALSAPPADALTAVDSPLRAYAEMAAEAGQGDPGRGNYVGILEEGGEALLARVHLIRAARHSVEVQQFIWTADESGSLVMAELIAAARRGVKVRVLVDHLGAERDADLAATLATLDPNLEIRVYRPAGDDLILNAGAVIEGALSFRSTNQRMHNKVFVFDQIAGITGGRNVEDTYFNNSGRLNFKDRDALVIGPAAGRMRASFDEFWDYRHTVPIQSLADVAKRARQPEPLSETADRSWRESAYVREISRRAGSAAAVRQRIAGDLMPAEEVRFFSDSPGKNRSLFHFAGGGALTRQLTETLKEARHSILIQTPYLVMEGPERRFFRRLREKHPDLDICISTNSLGSTDNLPAYVGTLRCRPAAIHDLGIRMYEYKPLPGILRESFPQYDRLRAVGGEPFLCLHSKSLVVDRRIAFIGSYNLDPRSANLNTESGLFIRDAAIAERLARTIEREIGGENSWVIAPLGQPAGVRGILRIGEFISGASPIVDLWPLPSTSAFELKPGQVPVPVGHPDFYDRYRDVGDVPGTKGDAKKEIFTRLLKALGREATPLL